MSEEQKPKKNTRMIGQLYDYDLEKGTIKLKNKKCPRCGNVMASHKSPVERWTCGSCSFTDYIKQVSKL